MHQEDSRFIGKDATVFVGILTFPSLYHIAKQVKLPDIALTHRKYLLSQDVYEMADGFHIHRTARNGKDGGIHC